MIGQISETLGLYRTRVKYVPDPETGELKIANVCSFSRPVFNPQGLERVDSPGESSFLKEARRADSLGNLQRATRRAKERCFDYILCNDLNTFVTLTYSPDRAKRDSWDDCYRKLSVWLSNRVQRRDMLYVAVPEYHKDGENIHFHMLANSSALRLVDSGHKRKGKIVYNVSDWDYGFSTALLVDGEDSRTKCAKYIFKYMGKQFGQMIGGRYYLSGGDLRSPVYKYFDQPEEAADLTKATYIFTYEGEWGGFQQWTFL